MKYNLSKLDTNIPNALYYGITAAKWWEVSDGPDIPGYDYYYIPPEYFPFVEKPVYASPVYSSEGEALDCPTFTSHRTHWWCESVELSMCGGKAPPFVQSIEPTCLVNGDLAAKLRRSGLVGLEVGEAKVDWSPVGERIYFLKGRTPVPTVPRVLAPGVKNVCPFCGSGPVFCPKCGDTAFLCPSCNEVTIRRDSPDEEEAEKEAVRFDIGAVFPLDLNRAAGVIDLKRVQQPLDFSGFAKFSRRALEFLLKENAFPLAIHPYAVLFEDNTIGYTREDAVPVAEYQPSRLL